jgi:hypothetical protein
MNRRERSDDLSQQQQQQLDPFGSFERLPSQQQQQQQPNYHQQQNYPNLNPFPSQQQQQQQQQQRITPHLQQQQQNYPNLNPFVPQQQQQQLQQQQQRISAQLQNQQQNDVSIKSEPGLEPSAFQQVHHQPDFCGPHQEGVTIKSEPGVTPRFEPQLEPRFELGSTNITPKPGLESTSNFSSNDLSLIASINKTTVLRGLVREYIDHQRGVLEICEVGHSGLLTEPVAGNLKIS